MSVEPVSVESRLNLLQARDLTQCYGHHRSQTLSYALHYCLQCRRIKSCVRKGWTHGRRERWQNQDWWPVSAATVPAPASPVSRSGRRPINIS